MNPHDFMQAHRDAALIRAGLLTASDPICHPEAGHLASSSEKLLSAMGKWAADVDTQTRAPGYAGRRPSAGWGTTDFGNSLADILRAATFARMTSHMDHVAVCQPVIVKNFLNHTFPLAEIESGLGLPNELGEFEESGLADTPGLSGQLRTFGRNVMVSRQLLLSDDIGLIAGAFANFGASAARSEARMAYGLLDENPVLGDGEEMISFDHGNIQPSSLHSSSLSGAMGMLRDMPDSFGEKSDLPAAVLLVHGGLELTARKLVHESGLTLRVVVTPFLSVGRWYLLPSPEVSPVIGLLRLEGAKGPVRIEPKSDDTVRDGSLMGVRADLGVVAMGRTVIRGGTLANIPVDTWIPVSTRVRVVLMGVGIVKISTQNTVGTIVDNFKTVTSTATPTYVWLPAEYGGDFSDMGVSLIKFTITSGAVTIGNA